jgi:tetratricopeptide (TPR) repeat protein
MLFSGEQATWLARLGREHDNLRTALRWLLQKEEPSMAVRLGIALWHYWYIRAHHLEGTALLEQILKRPLPTGERAKVLYGLGMLARRVGSDEKVAQTLKTALALFRQLQDEYYIASTLRVLGFSDYRRKNYTAAQQKLVEALHIFRKLDNPEAVAVALINLGYVQMVQRDYGAAKLYLEESLAIRRQSGNLNGIANCLDALGLTSIHQGNYSVAKAHLTESRDIYQSLGNKRTLIVPLSMLGSIAYHQKAYREADALYEQAFIHAKHSKHRGIIAETQYQLALTKLRLGKLDTAVTNVQDALHFFQHTKLVEELAINLMIFSLVALATERTDIGLKVAAKIRQMHDTICTDPLYPTIQDELNMAVTDVRSQYDAARFTQLLTKGAAMSLEEITDLAIESLTMS